MSKYSIKERAKKVPLEVKKRVNRLFGKIKEEELYKDYRESRKLQRMMNIKAGHLNKYLKNKAITL